MLKKILFQSIFTLLVTIGYSQTFNGNLTLTTQAEVDAFNYTVVNGDLRIMGVLNGGPNPTSDIFDLTPLSTLTTVTGNFNVDRLNNLTTINGLSALISVGGQLRFSENSLLQNLDDLSSLQSIGGRFSLSLNSVLTDVNGMTSLTTIGDDFTIGGNGFVDIVGFPLLTSVGGSFSIFNEDNLNKIAGFSSLTSIGNGLQINDNPVLETISGFQNWESTGFIFRIIRNPSLTSACGVVNALVTLPPSAQYVDIRENSPTSSSAQQILDFCTRATLRGNVYRDHSGVSCTNDMTDYAVQNVAIRATDGVNVLTGFPDQNGDYKIQVFNAGNYTVSLLPNSLWAVKTGCTPSYIVNVTTGDNPNLDFSLEFSGTVNCDFELSITSGGSCPNFDAEYCFTVANTGLDPLPVGAALDMQFPDNSIRSVILPTELLSGQGFTQCEIYSVFFGDMPPYQVSGTLTSSVANANLLDATYNVTNPTDGMVYSIYGNPNFDQTISVGAPLVCPFLDDQFTPVDMANIVGNGGNEAAMNYSDCGDLPVPNFAENSYRIDTDFLGVAGTGPFLALGWNEWFSNRVAWFFEVPASELELGDEYTFSFDYIKLADGVGGVPFSTTPSVNYGLSGAHSNGISPSVVATSTWQTHSYDFTIDNSTFLRLSMVSELFYAGVIGLDNFSLVKKQGCPVNVNAMFSDGACPFDPNDMAVTPLGCGPNGNVTQDEVLTYRVRFENIGFGSAKDVFITDVLDANLDISTLKLIQSSHDVTAFQVNAGNSLQIDFEDINLQAVQFTPDNRGYVLFSIKPLAGLPDGTEIRNSASIVFDQNEAIVTNEVLNTVFETPVPNPVFSYEPGCNGTTSEADFISSPNPAGTVYAWSFGSSDQNPSGVVLSEVDTLVNLQVDLNGCLRSVTRYVEPVLPFNALGSYAAFAMKKNVSIGKYGLVHSGSLGASGFTDESNVARDGRVVIGKKARAHAASSWLAAERVKLKKKAKVNDVFSNFLQNNNAIIQGSSSPLIQSLPQLPDFPEFSAGSVPVYVYADHELAEGDYGVVVVFPYCKLIINGNYKIEKLILKKGASVIYEGTSTVMVAGDVELWSKASIEPGGAGVDAADLVMYVSGRTVFGERNEIHANVYCKHKIIAHDRSDLTGSFIGSRVILKKGTQLTLLSTCWESQDSEFVIPIFAKVAESDEATFENEAAIIEALHVEIHPNPCDDFTVLRLNVTGGNLPKVRVVSAVGEVLDADVKMINMDEWQIDTGDLLPGVYSVIVEHDHHVTSSKIFKLD